MENNDALYNNAIELAVYGVRKAKDFTDLTPTDCITILAEGKKQMCILWQPIKTLDGLLAKSKELELKANGIDQTIIPQNYEIYCTSRDSNAIADFQTSATLTVTAVLNQYTLWLNRRELFIQGRPGCFFDFGNLAATIADICTLKDITTYSDLYRQLGNMLFCWTTERDTCEEFLKEERKNISRLPKAETPDEDFNNTAKQMAYMELLRSPNFKITDIALIYYKMRGLVMIEREIDKLRKENLNG